MVCLLLNRMQSYGFLDQPYAETAKVICDHCWLFVFFCVVTWKTRGSKDATFSQKVVWLNKLGGPIRVYCYTKNVFVWQNPAKTEYNIAVSLMYGDSVDNKVEENYNVFSLIRMRWLPSARACRQ